jgi:hypothetical protein
LGFGEEEGCRKLRSLNKGVLTWVAQVRLVACSLMALVFDRVVDVLVGFGEAGGGDALVGDVV